MSLQTAIRAGSIVSPALRMETPVIYNPHTHTMKTTEGGLMLSQSKHLIKPSSMMLLIKHLKHLHLFLIKC